MKTVLFAQAEGPDEIIPDTVAEIQETVADTLGGVWKDFLEHIPFLLAGILFLLLTWLVAKLVSSTVNRVLRKRKTIRPSLRQLAQRAVKLLVWGFGLLLTAMIIFPGLTPAKALGGLGLLSVAIGLAFKDIFENFFAGILILLRFPFEKGDFIECEGVAGTVEEVEVRMSRVREPSGELVVLPNSVLFKNAVKILTARQKRRCSLMTGVAYSEDIDEAVQIIQGAVEECSTVDKTQEIQVFPCNFGDSSIDIEVTWWTDPTPGDHRKSKAEIVPAIKKALDTAEIEIPFPYRTLTFNEPLSLSSEAEAVRDSEK